MIISCDNAYKGFEGECVDCRATFGIFLSERRELIGGRSSSGFYDAANFGY